MQNTTRLDNFQQLHQSLLQSRTRLSTLLSSFPHPPLSPSSFPSLTIPTISSLLSSLPSQASLAATLASPTTLQQKHQTILKYTGPSDLINDFKKGIENTKEISVDMYYLYALQDPVNLRRMEEEYWGGNELISAKIKEEGAGGGSGGGGGGTGGGGGKKGESNMLRRDYREYLKQEEDKRFEQLETLPPTLTPADLLIHVLFYTSHSKQKHSEFICPSTLLLSSLRDKFTCLIEHLSPSPTSPSSKSSFFFISQTFYPDTRYSRPNTALPIISCAKKNSLQYNYYPMQTTRLKNLRVELGRPWIWRHLDGCDHMVVFSEYRLWDEGLDLRERGVYPLGVYEGRVGRRRCEGCERWFAAVMVRRDKNKGGEDMWLCEGCYEGLCLQEVGGVKMEKYGGIEVWKYLHE